ncbi:MAG TPA: hypothetical protein VEC56_09140 [Candidatus Krumholzibacteria bacterium]|nr:hypothetical protein [Candidatus Krumholzibacteria bacterium]
MRSAAVLLLLWVALGFTPIRAATDSRPILYLALEGAGESRHVMVRAVSQDGSQVDFSIAGTAPAWSPDGRWIGYVSEDGQLFVTNTSNESKKLLRVDEGGELLIAHPMWSPDGGRIAVVVRALEANNKITSALVIVDVATRKVRTSHKLPDDVVAFPAHLTPPGRFRWSPDGRHVLVAWEYAVVVDVEKGRVETISKDPIVGEWVGDHIYYIAVPRAKDSVNRVYNGFYAKRPGQAATELMNQAELEAAGVGVAAPTYGSMVAAPNGAALAVSTGSPDVGSSVLRVCDLKAGAPSLADPAQKFELDGGVVALDWAPGQDSLAAVIVAGNVVSVVRIDVTSGERQVLATWQFEDPMEVELFVHKALSWTR